MKITGRIGLGVMLGILCLSGNAQKKQVDFIKDLLYAQCKGVFKPADKPSTITQKEYAFPWSKTSKIEKTSLEAALDSLMSGISCSKSGDELKVQSKFPANVDVDSKLFSMSIRSISLQNEKGMAVSLDTSMNFVSFGSEFHSSFETDSSGNTISTNTKRQTVSRSVGIKNAAKSIKGSLAITCCIVDGYDYVRIQPSDAGKEISFGGVKLKVLSVKGQVAAIKVVEGSINFDYLVADSNNEPYMGMSSKLSFAQQDYDFFSMPNAFDKATFDAYYISNKERMLSKDAVRDVIVVKGAGSIGNLYLYKPASKVTRRAEVAVNL